MRAKHCKRSRRLDAAAEHCSSRERFVQKTHVDIPLDCYYLITVGVDYPIGLEMASKIVSKLVRPPINLYGLEGRYVNALYSAAMKSNKLDSVEGDLKKLAGLYKTDSKFKDFMINPLVSPVQKTEVFEGDLKKKLNLNDLSVKFLSVMSENRRLKHLPDIDHAFRQIMAAVRNELPVSIISAKPLQDVRKKEIEASLKAFTSKKLLIEYETDSSLLGGLIIDFNGEHFIDMSVKAKVRIYSDICK